MTLFVTLKEPLIWHLNFAKSSGEGESAPAQFLRLCRKLTFQTANKTSDSALDGLMPVWPTAWLCMRIVAAKRSHECIWNEGCIQHCHADFKIRR